MIFEALGKDWKECNEAVHKVCQEAKEEALKKVKSGESEWLDDPDESVWLNNLVK